MKITFWNLYHWLESILTQYQFYPLVSNVTVPFYFLALLLAFIYIVYFRKRTYDND